MYNVLCWRLCFEGSGMKSSLAYYEIIKSKQTGKCRLTAASSVCVGVRVDTYKCGKATADTCCLLLSPLPFERVMSSWVWKAPVVNLASQQTPRTFPSPSARVESTTPAFHVGAGDPNAGLHAVLQALYHWASAKHTSILFLILPHILATLKQISIIHRSLQDHLSFSVHCFNCKLAG